MPVAKNPDETEGKKHVWLPYDPNFKQIILRRKAGDSIRSPAITAELEILEPMVLDSACRLMPNTRRGWPHSPQDAAQKWWESMFKKAGGFERYDGIRPFHRYGYTALKRICFERPNRRRLPGKGSDASDQFDDRQNPIRRETYRDTGTLPHDYDVADDRLNPLRDAIRNEVGERIRRTIARLKPTLRRVIIALFYEGLSPQEMATKEDVSVNAIYLRLFRAIKCLRSDLDEYREFDW